MLSSYRCHIYFHEIRNVSHLWNNFWKHFSTALKPWNAMNVSGNLDCVYSLFIDEETKNKTLKESKRRRMRASQWLRERESEKIGENWKNCDFRVFIIKIKTLMAGNRDHGARFTEEVNDDCRIDISRCSFTGKKIVFSGVVAISDWTSLLFLSLFISLLFKEKRKKEKKKIFDKRYSDFVDDLLLKQ